MSLENAPPEVKLAVDLIMLLEESDITPDVVLAALEIVRRDYESKAHAVTGPEPDNGWPYFHRHSREGGNLIPKKRVYSHRDPQLSPRMTRGKPRITRGKVVLLSYG
ncbi:hypothetical protein CS369_03920 [Candidatus Symbiopectobacterium sp. 'North America']|nr:hypothetical protein [Candidatus Symbiopectobacterium sp. 'North America']